MQAFLCPLQVAKKEVSPLVISLPRFHSLHSLPLLASLSHLARAMRCEDELSQLSNGFVVAAVECTYTLDHDFFVRLCVRRTNIPLRRKEIKCKTRCRRVSVGVCFVVAPIHPYTHPSIHPSCSPTILSAIQPSWHPRPSQEHPSEPLACST